MNWEKELENYIDKNTVIMGIGSDLKSDDRAGIYIAEEISEIGEYEVVVAGPTPEHWVGFIVNRGYKKLLIIDAVICGGNPGEIQVFNINEISERFGLTHSSSLHLFSDFLVKEGKIKSIKILAIEPESVDIGTELSIEVKKAAEKIIKFFESYNI
jgi:hydrogenase 3 maturation protease